MKNTGVQSSGVFDRADDPDACSLRRPVVWVWPHHRPQTRRELLRAWGNGPGTQFDFRIFPDLDTVMIVMSNYNAIAGNEIASALDDLIRRSPAASR